MDINNPIGKGHLTTQNKSKLFTLHHIHMPHNITDSIDPICNENHINLKPILISQFFYEPHNKR